MKNMRVFSHVSLRALLIWTTYIYVAQDNLELTILLPQPPESLQVCTTMPNSFFLVLSFTYRTFFNEFYVSMVFLIIIICKYIASELLLVDFVSFQKGLAGIYMCNPTYSGSL
jgi:hypothetical protein